MGIEKFEFQAEVGKILNIVANSLYSDKEIFIREYISNASDACDKLRYEKIKNPKLTTSKETFKILVKINKKDNIISIIDNGIGMDKDELINSLGTIAKSGTEDFIKKLEQEKNKNIEQIGKFGVGFYSGFMVSEKITVETRKATSSKAWKWSSDGKGSFEIEPIQYQEIGTKVTLKIRNEHKDFLEKIRIENIIKKYSDHISHDVFVSENDSKEKDQKINEGSALWTKDKKDIKATEYENFYSQMGLNYDKPWKIIHNKIEGKINYTNLLFIPTEKPFDLLHADKKTNLKLYIKKVFITDDCDNILPKYLRFISGIIDSEDISLNISREMLQNDPVVNKIRISLVKKILNELNKTMQKSKNEYIVFWEKFGPVLKEGIHEDFVNKDEILNISLFMSSTTKEWSSLTEYVDRMKDEQNEIYYISGENKEALLNSPQMETFLKNNVEVLLLTDPVDEFWIPNVNEFKNKKFKSITKGNVDVKKFSKEKKNEESKKDEKTNKSIKGLIEILKGHYSEKVKDVKISERLTSSPVCFVADENDMDIHLENLLKKHKHLDKVASKVLEINPDNAIIKNLAALDFSKNKDIISEAADLLLDQAKIMEGIPLEDSKSFCNNINNLLIKSLRSS